MPSLTVRLPLLGVSFFLFAVSGVANNFQIRSKYRLRSQSVTAELNADCSVLKKCP